MNRFILTLLLLTCVAAKAQTTKSFPDTYLIKNNIEGLYQLDGKYFQYYLDTTGKYTFGQIVRLPFIPAKKSAVNSHYTIKHVWTRCRIKNATDKPVSIFLQTGQIIAGNLLPLPRTDVYSLAPDGKWEHHVNGEDVAWSAITDYKRVEGFYFTIPAGQTYSFYKQTGSSKQNSAQFNFQIINSVVANLTKHYQDLFNNVRQEAFLLGFALLAAIVSLFFFYTSREKVYLYFSLFNLFFAIGSSKLVVYDIFFREAPGVILILNLLLASSLFIAWHFVKIFYQTLQHYPRWTRFTNVYSFCLIVLVIPIFFNVPASFMLIDILIGLVFVINMSLIVTCSIFKNRRELVFDALTMLPLLLGILLSVFGQVIFRGEKFVRFVQDWGMTPYYWMIVMFLLKLVLRYKVLQQKILAEAFEREKIAKENEMEKSLLIAGQKIELERQVADRTAELQASIIELKQAQNQLIQSEKMASLGELTAGIAHEIQNPLNFVNNFSEVSAELLAELKDEAAAGNTEEVLAIAEDLILNLTKINHHGKRADGIVKGMLQHSRASTGQKELTNLNKLAEEYLHLAYHGLRAKDKTFNAELVTKFDETLPPVNIIPQDIGRVLLNLINNAFYAVQEKAKTASTGFRPTVTVTTFAPPSGGWGASVTDNGTGIPEHVREKIMQPFFTTKPTGQGTGLGLSLSYDIVVKSHGGKIDVQSTEGEGTVFTITLPVS